MKNLIDIIDTANDLNILQKMQWGGVRKNAGAKPKYNEETITHNPMSQQITINEELLKGGFEMQRSYQHDEFFTFVFKRPKSNFYIELTYEGSELATAEMWCKDWEKINPDTIPLLAQFLNANNL